MAYDSTKDDTLTGITPSDYGTKGTGFEGARLRKINLNVDIATQDELNAVYNDLSAQIQAITVGTLSAYYTKTEANAISTELSNTVAAEIGAEASAREAADEAITASLSAYALSTTVADAYKVTVANPTEIEGDKLRYEVLQGGQHAGYLDIAKDQFVSAAAFDGTVLTLTLRDGSKISTDLGELADYTGVDGENALVDVNENHQISVYVKDYASKTYVDEVSATANAEITAAETAAKSYTDEVSTALSNAFEPRVSDNETVSEFVREMSATWDGGGSALQAISAGTDGTYVTTTVTGKDANNKQTVAVAVTTSDISSEIAGLAVNTDVKQYVDTAVAGVDDAFVKEVRTDTTAYVKIDGDTSLTGDKIVYVNLKSNVTDAVDKVEAASANWDAAEQNAKDYADSLSDNYDAAGAAAAVKEALISGDGITSADNTIFGVKAYADAIVADSSVTAAGDDIVSADADGKDITVGATDKLSTVVARVEGSADAWDQVSAKIDTATVVNAANQLSVLSLSALSDYNDIDEIITEVEKIKGALVNFTTALEA